ncbi:MAG: NAD(P)-dependent glycerol-3-phosphate dehydrogenase [Planctomycetota bacterium]|nr:MAG: NAD(P)-dependent glycerol-3-phosphate dehydrogenase [Planctomycetota bacterium]
MAWQIAVLGAGSWGSALADLLARRGHKVCLWGRRRQLVERIRREGENRRYLPGFPLCERLRVSSSLEEALEGVEMVVLAVPASALGEVGREIRPFLSDRAYVVSVAKGMEVETERLPDEILLEASLARERCYFLSGPSFAKEVIQRLPTAVVLAGYEEEGLKEVQRAWSTDYFRVYTTLDVKGVLFAGALKNVMAIAAGICQGLGFGLNTQAALITRGLAEMERMGKRLGYPSETLLGLAGVGDLVLTCTGDLSRNRRVGLELAKGRRLEAVLEELAMVAEGVNTARVVFQLSRRCGVEMPIVEQVYRILFEGKDAREAVEELMLRPLKEERERGG